MKIVKGRQKRPTKTVLYGVESIGKTTLASQWPRPLFLDVEDGTANFDVDRVRCKDWESLKAAVTELAVDNPEGYQTVVIDSVDWAERLCGEWQCKKDGKSSLEDYSYGKGIVMLAEHMARFVENLDNLHAAGLHVVLIGHSDVKRFSPPDQTDGYDRYELRLKKSVVSLFKEWCDALLFCNFRTRVVEGSDGRKKAIGGKERIIHAERSASWDAKNRFGLDEQLPMTIDALAPLFDGTGAKAPADTDLYDQVVQYIADAKNVRTLGKIGNRIDELLSTEQLSSDQWSALTDLVNARREELKPSTEVANG
jgi:hypothetical protein